MIAFMIIIFVALSVIVSHAVPVTLAMTVTVTTTVAVTVTVTINYTVTKTVSEAVGAHQNNKLCHIRIQRTVNRSGMLFKRSRCAAFSEEERRRLKGTKGASPEFEPGGAVTDRV